MPYVLELLERQFPIDSPTLVLKLKNPADYADALSVHINHLNRSVKEVTGKTTTAHIAARIVKEAKALLQHTDWNIGDMWPTAWALNTLHILHCSLKNTPVLHLLN
jgi:AraC family transcriptional activator of pobA